VRPGALEIAEVEPGRFSVTWKQPAQADRRLTLDPQLPDACAMRPDGPPEHTGSALIRRWHADCDLRSGRLAIDGLSATLTDVMVRIRYLDGTTLSRILRPAEPAMDLADPAPALGGYFALGVEHLLLGPDHILFVIGLVLLIGSPWMLVKTITAFTVAHSVTLALSVLELVRLPQGPVEAMIALSILYLARELTLPEPDRSPLLRAAPWIMAFAFGLLHGFGFAGALADIGLPRDQLAASLLLFNVGIEAGQLIVVGVLLGCAALARNAIARPVEFARARAPFVFMMGCVAAFWTIDRVVALG
jgi:hydrogenase/urease accessory protein HupE